MSAIVPHTIPRISKCKYIQFGNVFLATMNLELDAQCIREFHGLAVGHIISIKKSFDWVI